jgi:acetyl-CoA acetyltransferase family protein
MTYILDAVRTPFGRYAGALSHIRPDDLAAHTIAALMARHPDIDPALVDDVILGNANGAGEENRNVARMSTLLAGLPTSIPGSTVNRLCGSGLQSVVDASRSIEAGDAHLIIAGGVESMSRAPWVMLKPTTAFPRDGGNLASTTLGWRLTNPQMPSRWTQGLTELTDALAVQEGVSREEQDAFAAHSQHKAGQAWADGHFAHQVVAVPGADLMIDEQIRSTSTEALARLKPIAGGTVTAGNASGLNDGAGALLVASEAMVDRLGVAPLARIVSRAVVGVDPTVFGLGPVEAVNRAMAKAGVAWSELAAFELNEAFAAQALACLKYWPDLDPTIVNPLGGAIAMGHPLGASGARIVGSLAHQLHQRGGGYGVAALCIGVGQGIAVVLEGM